jgi:hypothetical protein
MVSLDVAFWQYVAKDLGLEIVAPYGAVFPDGSRVTVSALVKKFGGPLGMLVDPDWDLLAPHINMMSESGYGYSAMSTGPVDLYSREGIIDVLNDWGWTGEKEATPSWYTGKYWGQDEDEAKAQKPN